MIFYNKWKTGAFRKNEEKKHYIFVPSNKEYIKSEQTAVCTSIEFNFIINLAVW